MHTTARTSMVVAVIVAVVAVFVSIASSAHAADVKPVIGKATATPAQAIQGAKLGVSAKVTRSDNGRALAQGLLVCRPTAGTTTMSFPVTLSKASRQAVTVSYATANGSATAPADYASATGTLMFAPGETSKAVAVSVVADLAIEPDETLSVTLASPVNATIARSSATGTINQDLGGGFVYTHYDYRTTVKFDGSTTVTGTIQLKDEFDLGGSHFSCDTGAVSWTATKVG